MKQRIYFWNLLAALWCAAACSRPVAEGSFAVIPLPQEVEQTEDVPFVIDEKVRIVYPSGNQKMKANAAFLAGYVEEATGLRLEQVETNGKGKNIILELGDTPYGAEGYQLVSDKNKVLIKAATEKGVFYGIQTLRKAMPTGIAPGTLAALPAASIKDYPRLSYRGTMLDVGRHYFPVAYLKQFIDLLVLHNINTFHWHLTEDQGWRIEIKKYPELTKVGSKRKETIVNYETKEMDGKPYEGFYTQDEIREIVAYAAERYITVIPEIDMPGHMTAALASYPELGCTGGPYEVATQFGVFPEVLCGGNEKTLQFVKDVLTEVMELFPSPYIHIGGDECPKVRWKACPRCQAKIREQKIKATPGHTAENQLQTWFMTQVESFINEHGRRMIGWDEVLEGGLTPDATIMSWRGTEGGVKAAQQHHDVIITPISHLYFSNPHILKLQGLETVKRVYNFEPVPQSLDSISRQYVIGAQASIWTEWIKDSSRLEYVTLPRLAAAAEIFWTRPERKNIDGFFARLPRMLDIYSREGYEYRKDIHLPYIQVKKLSADSALVTCETFDQATIHYTTDGSAPDAAAPRYGEPFKVSKGTEIKAVAIREDKPGEMQSVKF